MPLTIKNAEVDRLVGEVAAMTGESKTEAVRKALSERKQRLAFELAAPASDRRREALRFLEREAWPQIPPHLLGQGIPREEQDAILGYGPDGA